MDWPLYLFMRRAPLDPLFKSKYFYQTEKNFKGCSWAKDLNKQDQKNIFWTFCRRQLFLTSKASFNIRWHLLLLQVEIKNAQERPQGQIWRDFLFSLLAIFIFRQVFIGKMNIADWKRKSCINKKLHNGNPNFKELRMWRCLLPFVLKESHTSMD